MKRRSIGVAADGCLSSWKFPASVAIIGCAVWMAVVLCILAVYSLTHTGFGAQRGFLELLLRLEKTNVVFIRIALVVSALVFVYQLFKRRWKSAAATFVGALFVSIMGPASELWLYYGWRLIEPPDDTSASEFVIGLSIPRDAQAATPGRYGNLGGFEAAEDEFPEDAYGTAIVEAVDDPLESHGRVTCGLTSLEQLKTEREDLLMRYLASHPGWHVAPEFPVSYYPGRWDNRAYCAMRRFKRGGRWLSADNDSYSGRLRADDFDHAYEYRVRAGIVFWGTIESDVQCRSGEKAAVRMEADSCSVGESCTLLAQGKGLSFYVEEEAEGYTAPRTLQKAFDLTEGEFARLAAAKDWQEALPLLPPDAVRHGEPTIELFTSDDSTLFGTSYNYLARVNPGERGEVYLKVFEVTREQRLSAERVSVCTREAVGWSDDPQETFTCSSWFVLYEGDGKTPYLARLELWFVPANGGPERKLIERQFKVTGGR